VVFLDVRTLIGHEGVGLEIPGEFFLQLWTPFSPTADRLRPFLNRKSNAEEGNEKSLLTAEAYFTTSLKLC